MISRLEYAHADEIGPIPESNQWQMIEQYLSVDSVLASLYKQYCEAKDNLGKLLISSGDQDPMTEIAWDMHDSLRSAIETRLIELKNDIIVSRRIAAIQANRFASRMQPKAKVKPTDTLNDMMAFMIWAGMVMRDNPQSYDVRHAFGRAS